MFPQATILFAVLLTPLYIWLTINVIRTRRRLKIAIGTGEHPDLLRATRAHGNFAEYVPLFLILLFLQESYAHNVWASYLLGGLFVAGRFSHAWSILIAEPHATMAGTKLGYMLRFRFYAMTHTFFVYGILAAMLFVQYAFYVTR
jgi:uncharacterized membrane protein YecN with MAPEG domain